MGAYKVREPYEKHINFIEEIDFQFDAISKFTDSVEQYAIPLHMEKRKQYQEESNLMEKYGEDYPFDTNILFDDIVYGHFRNIFFANAIICSYSYLERTLLLACRANERTKDLKIKDISGKGIIKYRTYLEKVVGLDFQEIENSWSEVMKLNKIRNHVAHDMDVQEENLKDIIPVYKNLKGVEVTLEGTKYSILFSSVQFIREFNSSIHKIIRHVFYERIKL